MVLNTGDAVNLWRTQFRPGTPDEYKVPLTDLRVRPLRRPTPTNTPRLLQWPPGRWKWLVDLARVLDGMPAPIAEAADAWQATRDATFTPTAALLDLGVRALVEQAESEWQADRVNREAAATVAIAEGIRAAAPAAYERIGELAVTAVAAQDEQLWGELAALAVKLREQLDQVEGRGTKPRRESLSPGSIVWWLGRPERWYDDGRQRLTAHALNEHGEAWEFAAGRTADDVIETLVELGARRAG